MPDVDLCNDPFVTQRQPPVNRKSAGPYKLAGSAKFILLNRNLLVKPVACTPRYKPMWLKSVDFPGTVASNVMGSVDVYVMIPESIPFQKRRAPHGQDIRFLLDLLGRVKMVNSVRIECTLRRVLSKVFKNMKPTDRLQRLLSALELLQVTSFRFDRWWDSEERTHCQMILPPPIVHYEIDNDVLRIEIDKEWRTANERYFQRVPLPVPAGATLQNVVLQSLFPIVLKKKWDMKLWDVMARAGLPKSTETKTIQRLLNDTKKWLRNHRVTVRYSKNIRTGSLGVSLIGGVAARKVGKY